MSTHWNIIAKAASVALLATGFTSAFAGDTRQEGDLTLMGNRFVTFNTVVRVHTIAKTRDHVEGRDESRSHTPKKARRFRETIAAAWPGAKITWAFSWFALKDQRPQYQELRELIVSYHHQYGDEITFIPGGYFAPMYGSREQVNRDLHDALQMVSEMVGDGYRPKSVVAGFLAADNLRYLAEEEGIHVCQGTIWSQFGVDNGDGDGSIAYPYYPSKEHHCKPAQGADDFIDLVNLDGWTVDSHAARGIGGRMVEGERWRSRQGIGPIETLLDMGYDRGMQAVMGTVATHFDDGFKRNGFAWVTVCWELVLVDPFDRRGLGDALRLYLTSIRERWPDAKLITQGEFGELWRSEFKDNEKMDYRFVHKGSGVRASKENLQIRWFMNPDFRLALWRDLETNKPEQVIDFTRYDLPAREPADPEPGQHIRNWSLMNVINQKQSRPQDKPRPLEALSEEDQQFIYNRLPELKP